MQKDSFTITYLYKAGEAPRPCHSEKEIEEAKAAGFGAYILADNQYPTTMYHVDDEGKFEQGRANDPSHAKELESKGWTHKPTMALPPIGDREPGRDPDAGAKVTPATTHDMKAMLERLAALEAALALKETAADESTPRRGPGRPPRVA